MAEHRDDAFSHMADHLKQEVGDVAAEAARTAVAANIDQATEAVRDRYDDVLRPARDAYDAVSGFTRARPALAIALAIGTGFVLGWTRA